jgi:hypothetical protein
MPSRFIHDAGTIHASFVSLIHYQNRPWRCPQENFRLWTTPVGLESQRSLGLKRGLIVHHARQGTPFVGDASEGRISLHHLEDGRRLCQNAKPSDVQFLAYFTWRSRLLPMLEGRGFRRDEL